jgi:hypothetical protein
LVLFHPVDGSTQSSRGENPIALPKNSTPIHSLRDQAGQSWTAFRGTGPIAQWQRHFDSEFRDQRWDRVHAWSETGTGRTAAFASAKSQQRAEVWLRQNAEGVCEGMLLIESALPAARGSK